MLVYTIGFGGKNAESFFNMLAEARIKTLVDIRLNNRSQLAGFTKAADLEFFLKRLSAIDYRHYPLLAPSPEILSAYRQKTLDWDGYVSLFEALMLTRQVDQFLESELLNLPKPICLLCSEPSSSHCHRSLIAQRIQRIWPDTEIIHL